MKHTNKFFGLLLLCMSFLFVGNISAQTEDYTCNVICLNQPDHIMGGVSVDLYDANGDFVASTVTDNQGYFLFEDLPIGESFTAKFQYDAENVYVDIEDAFIVLSHIFGLSELNETQQIAADVDGNNYINYEDFLSILYDYYIQEEDFPVGNWILPDWEFTMNGDKTTGGPAGVLSTGNLNNDDDEADKSLYYINTIYDEQINVDVSQNITVPIYLNENIDMTGMGLIMTFNNDLFDIVEIESPIEDLYWNVNENEIRIGFTHENNLNWNAEIPIVNIQLSQKHLTNVSQLERINISNETHVLDKTGKKLDQLNFKSSEFNTLEQSLSETNKAYPNPCHNYFNVSLDSEIKTVEYKLYNSLGQLVDSRTLNNNGELLISTENIKSGLYYYEINYQSKSITGPISIY